MGHDLERRNERRRALSLRQPNLAPCFWMPPPPSPRGHRTELNKTLPHVQQWARIENVGYVQNLGFPPLNRGAPKLPIFGWLHDNIATSARISSERNTL